MKDWKEGGHKVICKDLPKAIATAEPLIASTPRSSLNIQESIFGRSIPQENAAQNLCYDAMDCPAGSVEKVRLIIKALKLFPLCIEAWGLLGAYYRHDLPKEQRDYKKSVQLYENAIQCATKINPEWREDEIAKRGERPCFSVESRPYERALVGHAISLEKQGETGAAITAAKKILKWNPHSSIKNVACMWMLKAGDVENFANFMRDMDMKGYTLPTALAFADVLFQFMRWKKGEILEESVKRTLYGALETNVYVPDLLLQKENVDEIEVESYTPDGPTDAHLYVQDAQSVWRSVPGAVEWLKKQKGDASQLPSEIDLIMILRRGPVSLIKCKNTSLDGSGERISTLRATQRHKHCFGTLAPDFYWPAELSKVHSEGTPIPVFHRDIDGDRCDSLRDCWRSTTYGDIVEIPFWKILLKYAEDEEEAEKDPPLYDEDGDEYDVYGHNFAF